MGQAPAVIFRREILEPVKKEQVRRAKEALELKTMEMWDVQSRLFGPNQCDNCFFIADDCAKDDRQTDQCPEFKHRALWFGPMGDNFPNE